MNTSVVQPTWGAIAAAIDQLFDPVVLLEPVHADDGTIVDFRYAHANRAACAYNGFTLEQTVGRHITDMLDAPIVQALFAPYVQVFQTGVPYVEYERSHFTTMKGEVRTSDMLCVRVDGCLVVSWRDYTELEQAMRRADESRARLGAVLNAHVDPHVMLRALRDEQGAVTDFVIDDANDAALQRLPLSRERFVGAMASALLIGRAARLDLDLLRSVLRDGRPGVLNDEQVLHAVEGLDFTGWVDVRITRLDVDHLLMTWRDVTERHLAQQRHADSLQAQALTDELTGLHNRRGMHARIPAMLAAAAATEMQAALLFCDLDGFKGVNDRYGHEVGDEVLCAVADRLQRGVRGHDLVVRLSGDEMLIVLAGVHDVNAAVAIAEKLRAAIREPIPTGCGELTVTASFGVCVAEPTLGSATLLARADAAMYAAKRAGRDCIAVS